MDGVLRCARDIYLTIQLDVANGSLRRIANASDIHLHVEIFTHETYVTNSHTQPLTSDQRAG